MFAESRRRVSVEDAAEIVRALGAPVGGQELTAPPRAFRTEGEDLRSWFEQGAAALDRLLARKRPLTVGVFANANADEIVDIADETGIDLIQLAGGEPWGACFMANRQVIKVVHVGDGQRPEGVLRKIEAGSAIAVLLDKGRDAGDSLDQVGGGSPFGGGGSTFDWQIATSVAASLPIWLAGGLNADNIVTAIQTVRPWCVDVSSGVESGGLKDHAKIRDFVAAAKATQ